jgi:glutaminyl-tRNA synthetase
VKVKGVITWVGAHEALPAEIRLFDRLFTDPQPDSGGKDFLAALNPESLRVVQGFVEPALGTAEAASHWQFERHGYFVADRVDHAPGRAVFNRTTTLKDNWSK